MHSVFKLLHLYITVHVHHYYVQHQDASYNSGTYGSYRNLKIPVISSQPIRLAA